MPSTTAEQTRKQKVQKLADLIWKNICQHRLPEIRETGVLTPTNSLRHRATRELLSWANQLSGRWFTTGMVSEALQIIVETQKNFAVPARRSTVGSTQPGAMDDGETQPWDGGLDPMEDSQVPLMSKRSSSEMSVSDDVTDEQHASQYYAQDGSDFDWEEAHAGYVASYLEAGENPEVTEEEPETEPGELAGSRCGSCHWLDGDGQWRVGDVPPSEWCSEAEAAEDDAAADEGHEEEQWPADGDEDPGQANGDAGWPADEVNDDYYEFYEGPLNADDEDRKFFAEQWNDDHEGPDDEEQWKEAADEGPECEEEQWKEAADEGPQWEEEQWKEAADEGPECEQWKEAADEGPECKQWEEAADEGPQWEEEQWKEAADEGPACEEEQWEEAADEGPDHEQWKEAADEGPKEEQWKEAADDEGPDHEEEQWKAADGEGPNRADIYTWPRASCEDVTEQYPSQAERNRLDKWWSRYKRSPSQDMASWLDAATDAEKLEICNQLIASRCPKIPATTAKEATHPKPPADRTRDLKGIRDRWNDGDCRWNNSEERKRVLEGMDVNEMKRRDPKRKKVVDANRLARRVAYLRIEYQHRSGSYYVIENPTGSMLFEYPCIKARLRAHKAKSINLCLGAVGAPSRKCVTLWGTAPFLPKLYEQLSGTRRNQLRRIQSFLKMDISRGYVDDRGRARRVADLLDDHFKTLKPKPVVDELDMELMDSGDISSSDSGLEDLVGPAPP
ncbi:unnamed protein product [Symbiodinium microadriaticum]|nr:unnamed protein product [Symbiodinium microadriaticum]